MWQRADTRTLGSQTDLGVHNRRRIIAAVRRSQGISRADIARLSGLSKGTVTSIVQPLLQQGLLLEGPGAKGGSATGTATGTVTGRLNGRPGITLRLNSSYATAVGVLFTDARAKAIALDLAGQVRALTIHAFPSDATPGVIMQCVVEAIGEVLDAIAALAPACGPIRCIGVCVPGYVDAPRGVSLVIPGLVRWRDVPVVERLREAFDLPVYLDWRAYAGALAEQWYGAAREADDFLFVNIGDGVGMGIVLGGQLVRGASDRAGMLAHLRMPEQRDTPVCICGAVGCLQAMVAVPALIHRAQRAVADGVLTVLTNPAQTGAGEIGFEDLIAAAASGDRLATNVFEDTAQSLGLALADLIHLFNPPLIVIGGLMAQARPVLEEPLRRAVRLATVPHIHAVTRIEFSSLLPGSAIVGAGVMVLQEAIEADIASMGSVAAQVSLPTNTADVGKVPRPAEWSGVPFTGG